MKHYRKIILFVGLLTALVLKAQSPLALTMEDFSVKAGETKTVYVAMQNAGYNVIAIEFKMQLPEGLSLKSKPTLVAERLGSYEDDFGETVASGKTVYAAKNTAGYWTFSIFSMTDQVPFSGTEGNVIAMSIAAAANMAVSETSIRLYDIELSTKETPYYPEAYSNKVMVYNDNVSIYMAHDQRTFSCAQPLDFTDTGLKAYVATHYQEGKETLTRVMSAPAGTGLFLVGTEGETYTVPYTASPKAVSNNMLKPVLTAQVVPQTEGEYTNFLYGEVDGVKGFYKSSGKGAVAAGKAFLQLLTSTVNEVRSVDFIFSDETNGINGSGTGDLRFGSSAVYDLSGRKIENQESANRKYAKGVYIVGKRKIAK
jgi:hypothetical protein